MDRDEVSEPAVNGDVPDQSADDHMWKRLKFGRATFAPAGELCWEVWLDGVKVGSIRGKDHGQGHQFAFYDTAGNAITSRRFLLRDARGDVLAWVKQKEWQHKQRVVCRACVAGPVTMRQVQAAHAEYERLAEVFLVQSGWYFDANITTSGAWVMPGTPCIGANTLTEAVALQIGMNYARDLHIGDLPVSEVATTPPDSGS